MSLRIVAFLLLAAAVAGPASADSGVVPRNAIAMHGQPKYGPGFTHFDYLDPDAPKGGTIRLAAFGTFDSFNSWISKGNPADTGSVETLLTSSADEPFSEYGLLARSIETPPDRSWAIFDLRPEARWQDGQPVTADDVVWTFHTLTTKGSPEYRFYYASVASVEKLGERRVKFTFKGHDNREMPLIVGQMPILPKHYWEQPGHDFTKTTLTPPLGSGPYRVGKFEAGRYIVLDRVKNWWGRDLPVNRGRYNFDHIRTDYFRDFTVIREAIKSGVIDYFEENQAKAWATDYDVPQVRAGWLKKELIPNRRPTGMQAFVMNTRRPVFSDRLVRRALAYAFDFPWTNEHLFFGEYTRTESYFSNSDLAARGLPKGEELRILERFRGRIPDAVFTTPYRAPTTDGSGWPRANLRKAFALLAQAGWKVRDMKLVNVRTGQPMRFEILLVQQAFERVVLPFVRNLRRLGIDVSVRLVDTSQYINRLRSFDYDMIVAVWGESDSPGNEQRNYWSSAAAAQPGSRNFAGIRDPVVDDLIKLVISAPDRESLVARTHALDRVLLYGYYVIPNWHLSGDRILYWNKFSRPSITPKNGTSIDYWWYDPAKAKHLAAERAAAGEATPNRGTPPIGVVAVVALGVIVLGALVWRHVWQR